ncbi:uncharacterized protein A4U43_C03F30860 [Asparagus officinalis]|uniref:Uncharacterized protein n=1 Tax=Asparagus officinalis TaxID=4686 RepID=A0A5P1FE90_ASPOF|nr:uncharacterized protein A4U43_C03F30860 [Asparagus officinalis]
MASPPPPPPPLPGFRTPSGSLPMSPLSPMNQRAAATTELMLAGDESRFMGQSRIDRSLMLLLSCKLQLNWEGV